MMEDLRKTVLYSRHVNHGARMVPFGGWEMPLQYRPGIIQEHLETRRGAGLFDVSHMGRFRISGADALPFLQYTLSNNAAALEVGESQYTIIPNERGGAIDDAYLYRFFPDEYLLVVNAANREIDWEHLQAHMRSFGNVLIDDVTDERAMISVQGPRAKDILLEIIHKGQLPEPMRNYLSIVTVNGSMVLLARTGYTGEPICFELFVGRDDAEMIWDLLVERGARPVGLGARDTLRLEAGLPLYGHELGEDPEGKEIHVFAMNLSRFAVSFSPLKGDFIGREALARQHRALKRIVEGDYSRLEDLPRLIMPLAIMEKGIGRAGNEVYNENEQAGFITSGTMVPYWTVAGEGISSRITGEKGMRAIALALLDSTLREGDEVSIAIRGERVRAIIVPYHLRSEAPPYARAILYDKVWRGAAATEPERSLGDVRSLVDNAIDNTRWRQRECVNLIPSEMTASTLTRLLSILDPVGRYAEHRKVKAFSDSEVFYYQGTDFIAEVEGQLKRELRTYLGCALVETRLISGQMANAAFFSALVDYLNRADRKSEQRRIGMVLNNHIIRGGHLSSQPMGALRDFVAIDPRTDKPAVVNFPVMADDPYRIDVSACREIVERFRPEFIILGKSMMLYREPVAEMRALVDEFDLDCLIMYDMAHVLGLVGPHFQQPFIEGADVVTGSTHKTYFGTQRGIVAANWEEKDPRFALWEAVERRAFPGSVSNHHLGTMLGLLLAACEMNAFRDEYQKSVLENARAFARALNECGLRVAGDPNRSFTETHQVIVTVGYSQGAEIARLLEENNIIVNYQATPEEEGFTASGSLRMGVAEMTRFGMGPEDFRELAQLVSDVIREKRGVREEVTRLRKRFTEMRYCFSGDQYEDILQRVLEMI